MDPKDIDFTIKTGSENVINNNLDDVDLVSILSIISTFAENSLKSAAIYSEHSNRNVVCKTDIKLAMQWEVFMFLKRNNSESLNKNYNQILTDLNSENEDETNDNLEDLIELDESKCVFVESKCNCDICFNMNDINKRWCQWVPTTPIEKIFKKNIDLI